MKQTQGRQPRRVFYGWWIVLACCLMNAYHGGTFFYGFSVLFNPILQEFGWSRAAISGAMSIARFEGGLAGPIVGWMADRWGPRNLMRFGFPLMAVGFLLLSRIDSLWLFYASYVLASMGSSLAYGGVPYIAIANWFIKKRGRALGCITAASAVGSTLLLPLLAWMILERGWREAVTAIALGYLIVGLPLSLLVRHKPEQYGLLPDGEASTLDSRPAPEMVKEASFTIREALRTRSFWLLTLAFGLRQLGTTGLVLHLVPALINLGFSPQNAAFGMSFLTLISILGRFGFGFLSDLFTKRYVVALCLALQTVGAFTLAQSSQFWQVILFLLTFGLAYGGVIPLMPSIRGEYFGRRAFGTIQGVMAGLVDIGAIVGPLFAGWVFDVSGSYRSAFLAFSLALLLAMLLILVARPPEAREEAVDQFSQSYRTG